MHSIHRLPALVKATCHHQQRGKSLTAAALLRPARPFGLPQPVGHASHNAAAKALDQAARWGGSIPQRIAAPGAFGRPSWSASRPARPGATARTDCHQVSGRAGSRPAARLGAAALADRRPCPGLAAGMRAGWIGTRQASRRHRGTLDQVRQLGRIAARSAGGKTKPGTVAGWLGLAGCGQMLASARPY